MAPVPLEAGDPRAAFIGAATWHGTLENAEAILRAHPGLATADIHTAAILGEDALVRRCIDQDPGAATARSAPYGGDALNYLSLSRYLRLDPARTPAFLRAATALLDAGADPNTGFWTPGPHSERETALYGAAGVAHHAELTRLLIDRGAEPNDGEAIYHAPETRDLGALRVLVETGRLTSDSLSLMLIRKHDWHDYEGIKYLLEHGADPGHPGWKGLIPIHHAIARDNDRSMIELLLDHGADPTVQKDGVSAVARAARRGRGDLLELFDTRGMSTALEGVDQLIQQCARGDEGGVRALAQRQPALVRELLAVGPTRLAEFAGCWNAEGVRLLLDLGVPVASLYQGDGYFDIAPDSTALHVAAWKLRADLVRLLLERGAPVDAKDRKGRTALVLAVKGCVDSYWAERRTPEPARALLEAGASVEGVRYPTGYQDLDDLLRSRGAV